MHRSLAKYWIPAWLCLICAAPAIAAPPVKEKDAKPKAGNKSQAAEKPREAKADKKAAPLEFIRLRRDEDGKPVALETAIVRYVPKSGKGDVTLDLIGAVHVGDKAYYDLLNKRFEQYDAMLFELVAKKGTKIPKGGKPGGDMLPVQLMKNMLKLESQLEHIDYTKKNFVHADLSPAEMKAAMKKRNEDGVTLTLGILRDMIKEANRMEQQQAENPIDLPEISITDLLFPSTGAIKMKRFMAAQLASTQSMGAMGETLNTLLIEDRNQAALKVFQTQMTNGKRKLALFYGAAHFPDFEKRLIADYGMKRESITWVTAWDLK